MDPELLPIIVSDPAKSDEHINKAEFLTVRTIGQ